MRKIKTKTIELNGINVEVRRAKTREVKELIKDMATKVTGVANFIYNNSATNEEMIESVPEFIVENIEFIEEYILKFTVDFTQDDLDDLEFLDLIELSKEILSHNGINGGFIKSFFQNLMKVGQLTTETKNEFIQDIPKV